MTSIHRRYLAFLACPGLLLSTALHAAEGADRGSHPDPLAEPVRTAHNMVFAELLGNGLFDSVNYERLFGQAGWSARGGIGYVARKKLRVLSIPMLINYYVGDGDNRLGLGLGAVIFHQSGEDIFLGCEGTVVRPTGFLGYRYLPSDGGFTFALGATPFWKDNGVFLWGGTSFGLVF